MKTRRFAAATAVAVVALAPVVAGSNPAAGASGGKVRGEGSGVLVLPPFTGDRVAIIVEAGGVPSSPAGGLGRFDVTHFDKSGAEFARLAGRITCLAVHGNTVFLTGEIERGHAPDIVGDPVGQVLPITIADYGPTDLAGLAPPSRLAPACSPVPLNTVIDQGDYTVSS